MDQICINQKDGDEKAKQVNGMWNIYMRANITIAYLGEGSERSEHALRLLDSTSADELNNRLNQETIQLSKAWTQLIPVTTYFRRTWVLQEVLLSTNLICTFGTKTFSGDKLFYILETIMAYTMLDIDGANRKRLGIPTAGILPRSLTTIHNWGQLYSRLRSQQSLSLWEALRLGRSFDANDGRDKVWGLLGLVSHSELKSDYSNNTAHVYTKIAEYLVADQEIGVQVLEEAGRCQATIEGLPSWVPDWSNDYRAVQRVAPNGARVSLARDCCKKHRKLQQYASDKLTQTLAVTVDQELQVSAHHCTRIRHIGPVNQDLRVIPSPHQTTLAWYEDSLTWLSKMLPDSSVENKINNFISICLLTSQTSDHTAFRHIFEHMDFSNLATNQWMSTFPNSTASRATLVQNLTDLTTRKALVITDDNHLALVPGIAAVGDPVVTIEGLIATFVLRRVHTRQIERAPPEYELLGEAHYSESFPSLCSIETSDQYDELIAIV